MAFRFSHRTRRRVCSAMVFVWLFAVLASAVNACLVSAPAHTDGDWHAISVAEPERSDHDEDHDHGLMAHTEDQGIDSHGDEHASGHAGCHKFCKDESATLTKSKHLESPDFSYFLVDTAGLPWPSPPAVPRTHGDMARPPAQGPPLVIRFLRLTL